ncbi:MAG TPA: hypothetical protein VE553_01600, partial [Candidatus Binatia bacterium]|nr:hypothetical protein [Candidatus Binatia bacterium]
MTTPTPEKTVFHVDREHKGVRYAVVAILLVSFAFAFAALSVVLRLLVPTINTTAIISCLGAVVVSLLITAAGESILKRSWHSGRTLTVGSDRVVLHRPEDDDKTIDRQKIVNPLWWQIPLAGYARGGRERRIPAKWRCVAGQLQQDETRIVAYSYVSPSRLRTWQERYNFQKLSPEKVYNTSFAARLGAPNRPQIPPEIIAGK